MKLRFFFGCEVMAGERRDAAMALLGAVRACRHDEPGALHEVFVWNTV
jgi:hypothetical protein